MCEGNLNLRKVQRKLNLPGHTQLTQEGTVRGTPKCLAWGSALRAVLYPALSCHYVQTTTLETAKELLGFEFHVTECVTRSQATAIKKSNIKMKTYNYFPILVLFVLIFKGMRIS